jgi:hypothetical protein
VLPVLQDAVVLVGLANADLLFTTHCEAKKENKGTLIHRLLARPLFAREERRLVDGTRMMIVHQIGRHLRE